MCGWVWGRQELTDSCLQGRLSAAPVLFSRTGTAPPRGGLWPSAIQCPRSMLLDSGAFYPVEAPVLFTEQSGSDNLQTPFKRLPRRPQVPGRPFYAPVKRGSGARRGRASEMPVSRPRRFFGFFLIAQKETRRPQTAKYPENKREVSPLRRRPTLPTAAK